MSTHHPNRRAASHKSLANERLYPSRFSERYYILTLLRRKFEGTLQNLLTPDANQFVIDFGCGAKPYQSLLTPYAQKYVGVDFPSNTLADIHVESGMKVPLPDACADIVISTQVLEHVAEPLEYLR